MKSVNTSILNPKDVLILQKLLEDGRASSSQISKEIDLGREIVHYRIRRLIKENLIVKFIPKIDSHKIEYQEYTILLKLNLEDNISKEEFVKNAIGNKYLLWVIKSQGKWDLIVRLFAKGVEEFKTKLNEILNLFSEILTTYYTIITSDEITSKKTNHSFDTIVRESPTKDFKDVKKETPTNIDERDRKIIYYLLQDARIQYKRIGDNLNISSDTVRYRIDKMKRQKILQRIVPVFNYNKLGFLQCAGIIRVSYLKEDEERGIELLLKEQTCVVRAIKSLSEEEYFLLLAFKTTQDKAQFKQKVTSLLDEKIISIEIYDLD